MQKNEYFEKLDNKKIADGSRGEYRAYSCYNESKRMGSDILEVNETIWDNEVCDFVKTLRSAGIDEFALTQRTTALIDLSVALEAEGCILKGTCKVVRANDYETIVNGLKFRIVC